MALACVLASLFFAFVTSAEEPKGAVFRDVAADSGIRFRFHTGTRGKHDLVEIMGGGIALIDANADGLLDLYLCNGGPVEAASGASDPPCRLFLNQGGWRFVDATEIANAPGPSYAMGAAVGDFDNDGRDDLFVTGWRGQTLYRNLGGGRFDDVTERAGLVSTSWSTSAAFADLDSDGDLDIYVCSYCDYDPMHAPYCAAPDGLRDYCGPEVFRAQPDKLFRNNGDSTFSDVTATAGISAVCEARGLGVLVADFDDDGLLDLFVSNDGTRAFLFRNTGELKFKEVGQESGVAFDPDGHALAGMGVAWGDADGDGKGDLFVANFLGRSTIGYRNLSKGQFQAITDEWGLRPTRDVLGFGLLLNDFDGDGTLDLLQVNGHVLDRVRLGVPLAMRPKLLVGKNGRFSDRSTSAGAWFNAPVVARGLAVGDLDGDGRPDAVVSTLDAGPAVLRNVSSSSMVAITLKPRAGAGRAIGAKIRAEVDGRCTYLHLIGGGSYLSASSQSAFLGLGEAERVELIEVIWPSGVLERWRDIAPGLTLTLEEGKGTQE
jgi:hypothetical protein